MVDTVDILDKGYACLVEAMGVINAEYFISLIKRDNFDYTVWQREYFDNMKSGEFAADLSEYAKKHPYSGKAKMI